MLFDAYAISVSLYDYEGTFIESRFVSSDELMKADSPEKTRRFYENIAEALLESDCLEVEELRWYGGYASVTLIDYFKDECITDKLAVIVFYEDGEYEIKMA